VAQPESYSIAIMEARSPTLQYGEMCKEQS